MTKNHEKSSGNVFADLGFPNSGQELVKAQAYRADSQASERVLRNPG
jgi:hypothetical protein